MAKPFVRWSGGKRGLLPEIKTLLPKQFNTYYEPFVGGGMVFWSLKHKLNVICDLNVELINAYKQIQFNIDELKDQLVSDWAGFAKSPMDRYYTVREVFNKHRGEPGVKQASRFLILSKACFNGLYRVNKKDCFNVPFDGSKADRILEGVYNIDFKVLDECHRQLVCNHTQIRHGDYTYGCKDASLGDLIYADPPYAKVKSDSFTAYACADFSLADQIDLANFLSTKADDGCYVIASNSAHPAIRELYADLGFTIHDVAARRSINCKADGRGKVPEIIITNSCR